MTTAKSLFCIPGMKTSVQGLFKEYRVREFTYPALQGVSFDAQESAVTIIRGPSGCGKSTLLNLLGGIDRATKGKLLVGERDLGQIGERNLERYRLCDVGFVFQAYNLIPSLTALQNLELPMTAAGKNRAERAERGKELLELVGMRDKASKRPDELSGGEQQRVAISLALVNDPPLLLADEPTGNLDSHNGKIVTDLLCLLAHDYGKTVIIATHDPAIAARGDQVLEMRDGKVTN